MGGFPENLIDPWSLSKWGGGGGEGLLNPSFRSDGQGGALKILFLCPAGLSLAFK